MAIRIQNWWRIIKGQNNNSEGEQLRDYGESLLAHRKVRFFFLFSLCLLCFALLCFAL